MKAQFVRRVSLGVTLAFVSATVAAAAGEEVCGKDQAKVHRFGNPATRFSEKSTGTVDAVRAVFEIHRLELQRLLGEAGWSGDPGDLFEAAIEGELLRLSYGPGYDFEWMVFRRKGEPVVEEDICYAGKEPFVGWQLQFDSRGRRHTFVVPEDCLNLSYVGSQELPKPECSLTARFDEAAGEIRIDGRSQNADGLRLTRVEAADGGGVGKLRQESDGRWAYPVGQPGSYRFAGEATGEGGTATCLSDAVEVPGPQCRLTAAYSETGEVIDVDASGSSGRVTPRGTVTMTRPDGSTHDTGESLATGADRWTFDPDEHLRRKAGDYVFAFTVEADRNGATASCDATAVVTVEPRDDRWIVRGFYADLNPATDRIFQTIPTTDFTSQRSTFEVDPGSGFGVGVEYLATRRLGLELSLVSADLDATFMFDIDDLWETARGDFDFTAITLGLNVHLTPDHRADVYIGPILGSIQYDDETFRALGQDHRRSLDDDFALGANLGVDLLVGEARRWGFSAGARYLDSSVTEEVSGVDLEIDPLILTAGLSFRF